MSMHDRYNRCSPASLYLCCPESAVLMELLRLLLKEQSMAPAIIHHHSPYHHDQKHNRKARDAQHASTREPEGL